MRNSMKLSIGLVAVTAAFALSGCVASAEADGVPRSPNDFVYQPVDSSAAQEDLLRDGVTEDDYRAGFANYRACMTAAGYELFMVDESTTVIQYSVPDTAVQAGVHQQCYAAEFVNIDIEWQLAEEGQ